MGLIFLITQLMMFAARSYFSDEKEGVEKHIEEGHARFEGDENMEVIADIGLVVPEGVTHIQIDYCIS
jgi:hypothetical protein